MNNAFEGLEPRVLWHYFRMITQIPRGSGNEGPILERLTALASERGVQVRRDRARNLVMVVPAAPGCESWPTVVLQGHVDMVCAKDSEVEHDFATQGIEVVREGDWLTARHTTLGGDNGVAVAAELALLDDPPPRHGPLELLFTVDEERGLTGAGGLEPHMLTGRLLLNLDSEEEGYVTVGCAGGADAVFELDCPRQPREDSWQPVLVKVGGLTGGHSGVDIVLNRANALGVLGRLLDRLRRSCGGLRLIRLEGGTQRNAIPREARCLAALPPGELARARQTAGELQAELAAEFAAGDPALHLSIEEASAAGREPAFSAPDSERLVALLLATPSGVLAMSRGIAGLVETSTNLGVVATEGDTVRFESCSRSSLAPALTHARERLRALGEALGARVSLEAGYPGWSPNLQSPLLATFSRVHRQLVGKDPKVTAIHAGLECGILGQRFPGLDMISFGPDLKGVHAPGERLSIPSTGRFYLLLKAVLEALR